MKVKTFWLTTTFSRIVPETSPFACAYLQYIHVKVDSALCSPTIIWSEFFMVQGCKKYICVQPSRGVKRPLAHKELLYEVPSLRVTSVSVILRVQRFASAKRFCKFGGHFQPGDASFRRIFVIFRTPAGGTMKVKTFWLTITFSRIGPETSPFACAYLQYMPVKVDSTRC